MILQTFIPGFFQEIPLGISLGITEEFYLETLLEVSTEMSYGFPFT